MNDYFSKQVKEYQARYAYLKGLLDKDDEMMRTNPGKVPRDVNINLLRDLEHCEHWLRRQGQPLYPSINTPTPFADQISNLLSND